MEAAYISLTSAPESAVTVASFRTWRGSQHIVAKRPIQATITGLLQNWRRERDSNPRYVVKHTHTFQACAFDRSATSPLSRT
jgi:hypothetical protein